MYLRVRPVFYVGHAHEVICGHAIEFRQRHDIERTDVLEILVFVLIQRGLGYFGGLRQFLQCQTALLPQVLQTLADRENDTFYRNASFAFYRQIIAKESVRIHRIMGITVEFL